MKAIECAICRSNPVFYHAPTGAILGCCGNGQCKTREKPPTKGNDLVGSISMWNLTHGR